MWWVVSIGVANTMQYLWHLKALPNDSKHNEANYSMISMNLLCLRVAQIPRFPNLMNLVLKNRPTNRTDCFTPCACAQGNNIDD
jgi:hypothetical protein